MKCPIILFLFYLSFFSSCQTKQNLYLLFEKKEDIMYVKPYSILDSFNVFVYKIYKSNKTGDYYKEIFFDPAIIKKDSLYSNYKKRDKPKIHQKEISSKQLNKKYIKDHKWLEKKINSLKPFQELNQFYYKIYIIQVNPNNKKTIITEVENIEIIE